MSTQEKLTDLDPSSRPALVRGIIWTVIGLSIAVLLYVGLFIFAGIRPQSVFLRMSEVSATTIGLVFLTVVVHMVTGAEKWRAVLIRVAPESPLSRSRSFYFCFTCVPAVLAQFLTVHLSSVLTRALAVRMFLRGPALTGLATSLMEQTFDVYVLGLFAVTGIGLILADASLSVSVTTIIIASIVGGMVLKLTCRYGIELTGWCRDLGRTYSIAAKLHEHLDGFIRYGLLDWSLFRKLYFLSLIRYCAMLVRSVIVFEALLIPLAKLKIAQGFMAVQLAQIIEVVPGGLGIAEWTWSGYLIMLQVPASSAAEAAISLRLFTYASILGLSLLALAWFFATYASTRHIDKEDQA